MNIKFILIFFLACLFLGGCKQSENEKDASEHVVKMGISSDPHTLDPRHARSLEPVTILHMLYEGLMRTDAHGKVIPGIAEKVDISDDLKTYTFHLRNSFWSNGDTLTSNDFIATWKDILSPEFPAPNAYQFYLIKGAKEVKEERLSFEKAGIKAPDAKTLVVELDSPAPYFLEMLTTHFFYPVHRQYSSTNAISNGPFALEGWQKNQELSVVKNPRYWDAGEVRLHRIKMLILNEHTALRFFDQGELEWAGSPMGTLPQDAIATLKHRHQLHILPAAGVHWFRINTEKTPFQSVKMRRAFAYALDRKSIVEHVTQGNQKPALGVVPPFFGLKESAFFEDHDTPKAWYAFQEALEELNISKDALPKISLCYANSDRNHKIAQAVQQQWKKVFNLDVHLENCESQIMFDKLARKNYQIAIGSWFADYRDPVNFLDLFKYRENTTNNTQWENNQYIKLLNLSSTETDQAKRYDVLKEAEGVLMEGMPVIPLFFGAFNYVKANDLYGVIFSELGYLDFKYAFYGD